MSLTISYSFWFRKEPSMSLFGIFVCVSLLRKIYLPSHKVVSTSWMCRRCGPASGYSPPLAAHIGASHPGLGSTWSWGGPEQDLRRKLWYTTLYSCYQKKQSLGKKLKISTYLQSINTKWEYCEPPEQHLLVMKTDNPGVGRLPHPPADVPFMAEIF